MSVSDVGGSGAPRPDKQIPPVPSPIGAGRVAVVTGAASGIGLGLSQRFAAEGMNVVMADVEEPALSKAAAEVASSAADAGSVLPVVTDVADKAADEAELAAALRFNELTLAGATPAEVAGMVVDGIRSRRFYILTSASRHESVLQRAREIVSGVPPEPPVPFV